mmetsp:Transcript_2625/g.6864  ORF Transcript_2625/g.6864 Transcript_2625/m.6864 type:complete len:200 (-) Transcript_2625:880-1479(-)
MSHPSGICFPSTTNVFIALRGIPPDMALILIDSLMTASRYGHSSSRFCFVSISPCLSFIFSCSSTSLSHASGCRPRKSKELVKVEADVSLPANIKINALSIVSSRVNFLDTSSSSVANNMPLSVDESGPSRSSCDILFFIFSSTNFIALYPGLDLTATRKRILIVIMPVAHCSTACSNLGISSSGRSKPRICLHATSNV